MTELYKGTYLDGFEQFAMEKKPHRHNLLYYTAAVSNSEDTFLVVFWERFHRTALWFHLTYGNHLDEVVSTANVWFIVRKVMNL